MIVYRIVHPDFSKKNDILSGLGAHRDGGRWNSPGIRAVYCATEIETCVAEKAFYTLTHEIELLLLRSNGGKSKAASLWDRVINQQFVLATIDLDIPQPPADISTQAGLTSILNTSSVHPNYQIQDYRKSPYIDIPGRWTQGLGDDVYSANQSQLKALSARSNSGTALVLFSALLKTENIKSINLQDIFLSAVDTNGKKIKHGKKPVLGKVHYEYSTHKQVTDILNFSI